MVKGWFSRLDVPGALLLAGTLLALNLGLSAGGELGAPAGGARALGGTRNPVAELVLPLLAVAVVLGVLLVRRQRQRRMAAPAGDPVRRSPILGGHRGEFPRRRIVDRGHGRHRQSSPRCWSIRQSVSRVSALMLAPFTVMIALLSLAGGRIVSRVGFRLTASLGLVLVAIGYAALWLGLRGGMLIGMVPGLVLAGAGFGLVFAPIGATAIDAAPDPDRGIAAAMTLVFRLLGMTIGISTLTAIAVRRLQGLVGNLEEVVQAPGESTADFLARQTALLYETVLPVSLQVARETFLLAGAIALLGLIPVAFVCQPPDRPADVRRTLKSASTMLAAQSQSQRRGSCRDRLFLASTRARSRRKCIAVDLDSGEVAGEGRAPHSGHGHPGSRGVVGCARRGHAGGDLARHARRGHQCRRLSSTAWSPSMPRTQSSVRRRSGTTSTPLPMRNDSTPWPTSAAEVGTRLVASITIAKLAHLARTSPEDLARTVAVGLPHDWLNLRLTGNLATDRGEASGSGWWSPRDGRERRDLLALAVGDGDGGATAIAGGPRTGRARRHAARGRRGGARAASRYPGRTGHW